MDQLSPWLGDLNEIRQLSREWIGLLCIVVG